MTIFFDVYNVDDWDNAVKSIANGKEKKYTIILHDDITITPTNKANYTFGSWGGITVTIKGKHTICIKNIGSLLCIQEYQKVIIKDITLQGMLSNNSPVVYTDGDFYMKGCAKITGNSFKGYGGGVHVTWRGSITMQDNSMIAGNGAEKGGGVCGSFTNIDMYDNSTISENTAENGGGVNIYLDGNLHLHDNAKITKNKAINNGGGVFIEEYSYFIMDGHSTILENTAENGGGVYINDVEHSFDMNDNTVIAGNTAINGGGVYIRFDELIMNDNAIIKANTASDKGGGVYIESKGNLEKNGGIIFGSDESLDLRNKASDTKQNSGHAVYWDSSPARYRNVTASPNDNTSNDDFWIESDETPNGDSQSLHINDIS